MLVPPLQKMIIIPPRVPCTFAARAGCLGAIARDRRSAARPSATRTISATFSAYALAHQEHDLPAHEEELPWRVTGTNFLFARALGGTKERQEMSSGSLGTCCRCLGCRLMPLLVLVFAVFIGWLQRFPIPEGAAIAILFPTLKGQLPWHMFGQGYVSTPPVPAEHAVAPRPAGESFVTLPGAHRMPQNGLGMCCRASAYDPESVYNTVLWYLVQGGRHIDTAHVYTNHQAIGEAIREAGRRGISREEIFVTTKLWPGHFGFEKPQQVVPTYLDELGLDYVDLVLLHMAAPLPYMLNNECIASGWDNKRCRQETWRAMSLLRDSGVTRNVGVSNFNIQQMKQMMELELAPIAVNQFQYNPWAPKWQHDVFRFCEAEKVAVTAYQSFGGAFAKSTALTAHKIQSVAAKHNKTVAQVLLRWGMEKGAIIIPGTGNPVHQKENLDVYGFALDASDMELIKECSEDEGAKDFFYLNPDET